MTKKTVDQLAAIATIPVEGDAFERSLQPDIFTEFLLADAERQRLVLFASLGSVFLHSVLVPKDLVSPPDRDDLLNWSCAPSDSWAVSTTFGETGKTWISSPLERAHGQPLPQGEQLVFRRSFEGRYKRQGYTEMSQRFAHVTGIHLIEERDAYCRIDSNGDMEDVVRTYSIDARKEFDRGTVVTADRLALDEYASLTSTVLVRLFDVTRVRTDRFHGWKTSTAESVLGSSDLRFRFRIDPAAGSYFRGFQIVESKTTEKDVRNRLHREISGHQSEYAEFIAYDWKHHTVDTCSCSPDRLGNYFVKSDFPYSTSPVFFRPEVLLKYKADREKYKLETRRISCRGAWSLQTFDINDEGQVHTYLKYLGDLPYSEQLHWKQYNEPPKSPISNRAFTTDFEGQPSQEYDPLQSIKRKIARISESEVPWWKARPPTLLERAFYTVTESIDEWGDDLLNLDQLLIEGFDERHFRKRALSLGRNVKPEWRSIALLEECLIGLGFEADSARSTVAAFRRLHDLRSKVKGHGSHEERATLRANAIREHGSLMMHFRWLCQECDDALGVVIDAFEKKPPGSS